MSLSKAFLVTVTVGAALLLPCAGAAQENLQAWLRAPSSDPCVCDPSLRHIDSLVDDARRVFDFVGPEDSRRQWLATQIRILEKLQDWAPTLDASDRLWLDNVLTTFIGSLNNHLMGNRWNPNGDLRQQYDLLAQGRIGGPWWQQYDRAFAAWKARFPNPRNAAQPLDSEVHLAGMTECHVNKDLRHALLFYGRGRDPIWDQIGKFVQQAAGEVGREYNAALPDPLQRPGPFLQELGGKMLGINPGAIRNEMRDDVTRVLRAAKKDGAYAGIYPPDTSLYRAFPYTGPMMIAPRWLIPASSGSAVCRPRGP